MPYFSTETIDQLRADTPGTAQRIHLNNAGAALMPKAVVDAMQSHLELELRIGGYEAAAQQQAAIDAFYPALAQFIGAESHQIAYTSNATDAYNRALSAIPFQSGDVILTTDNDYVSNQIAFLQLQQRYGVVLQRAKELSTGGVDPEDMRTLILRHRPRLVAVTHVPTNSGLVQDVATIGAICREQEILYLVDACQSVGQLSVNVSEIQCDFLSATFRKFLRGPRGAGFLYVSERVLQTPLEPLFLDLRSAAWTAPDRYRLEKTAKRFELWERPYALLLGAKAAVQYASAIGITQIETRVQTLSKYLRSRLMNIPAVRVLDYGQQLSGIVTIEVPGWEAQALKQALQEQQINTSVTDIGSARIDFAAKKVSWALRFSPHYYNTIEEIDQAVATLAKLIAKKQKVSLNKLS